jgi:hypothetical protein
LTPASRALSSWTSWLPWIQLLCLPWLFDCTPTHLRRICRRLQEICYESIARCNAYVHLEMCFTCGDEPAQIKFHLPIGRTCDHGGCRECMTAYLESLSNDNAQIKCWDPQCAAKLRLEKCGQLLGFNSSAFDRLSEAENLAGINLVRCPNLRCGTRFVPPAEGDHGWPESECEECHHHMCTQCEVPWHAGYTCDQYQRLPAILRNADDSAVLELARQQGWHRCPNCRNMVERLPGGCNFMRCRCHTGFCYLCGVKYISLQPTPRNVHGTPGCEHPLFGEPPDLV